MDEPGGNERRLRFLLVEDDEDSITLLQAAIEDAQAAVLVDIVRSAEEALVWLRAAARARHLPDLVLLDLNLPGASGLRLLTRLKADEELGQISVVIMSSSNNPRDVTRSYLGHAAGYLCKPMSYKALIRQVAAVTSYWSLMMLPEPRPPEPGEVGAMRSPSLR